MKLRKFVRGFIRHNTEQFRKLAEEVDQPHHKSPVRAQLNLSERVEQPLGWVGGATSAAKPERPNMHQVCDLDCTRLPAEVWGGLGPRSGRMILYVGWTDRLTAEIVFLKESSAPAPVPARIPAELSSYHSEFTRYPEFVPALPAWSFDQVDGGVGEDSTSFSSPFSDLPLASNGLRPKTLDQLKLLVEVAHRQLQKNYATQKAELANAQGDRDAELRSVLRKQIAEYSRLIQCLAERFRETAFTPLSWAEAYDELKQSFALEVEEQFAAGEPLIRVLKYHDVFQMCEQAGHDNRAARKLREFTIETSKVIKEQFDGVPTTVGNAFNYAGHREYRAEHPEAWEATAERVRWVRAEYTRLCFEHFETLAERMAAPGYNSGAASAYFFVGKGHPPETLEDALQKLAELETQCRSRLAKLDDTAEQDELRARMQASLAELAAAFGQVATLRSELTRADGPDFMAGAWADVPAWLDSLIDARVLSKGRFGSYETLRGLMMQQTYREAPEGLDAETKDLLERLWKGQQRSVPVQIGGTPRGWCKSFIQHLPESVLLFQVASSDLAGFMFGDVCDLVVSADRKQVARGDFSNLRVDISN